MGRRMADPATLHHGPITVQVQDGGLRNLTCNGIEVLRALTYPVRNRDWGTCLTRTTGQDITPTTYTRHFTDPDGSFSGTFRARLTSPNDLVADVTFTFHRATEINRAGFTLLHPIKGVAGQPLTIHHPDGSTTVTTFPALISPAQPARSIAGLTHSVNGTTVEIALQGDVFEMEDQRNWSDASFKTYCRPLSLPYPYAVAKDAVIRQSLTLNLAETSKPTSATRRPSTATARLPQVLLAHEHGLTSVAGLAQGHGLPILFRLTAETPTTDILAAARVPTLALEIIFDDLPDLSHQIARAGAVGMIPIRVTALPRPFLKSYQPDAIWPTGAQPADALPLLRAAFPKALVGGGSLTNFTELNRHRPNPAQVDFVTFGNTAIVHAADDVSVRQTLEALPEIFTSAQAIAAGKPLHLGLFSIGMRSNPYGDATAPNPDGLRLPMAMADPRQPTPFAAAYAVAILAHAARAGVKSLALAMTDGPLGPDGPLVAILRVAHLLGGAEVSITEDAGRFTLSSHRGGLAANCTPDPAPPPHPGLPALAPDCATAWTM